MARQGVESIPARDNGPAMAIAPNPVDGLKAWAIKGSPRPTDLEVAIVQPRLACWQWKKADL